MQDFVREYIEKKQAELDAKCESALAAEKERAMAEREARLIRLGMCKKEYSESQLYSVEYPYQERKTGKFYRLVPFAVTDEEYAEICRYDDSAIELRPERPVDRLFSGSARNYRRTAALRFFFGVLVSLFLAVILYLIESDYIFLSIGAGILLIFNAGLNATETYMAGKTLARAEHLLALAEKESQK